MTHLRLQRATRLKATMASGVFILWVGYVIVSYYQAREEFKTKHSAVLLQAQETVNEALDQLHQFLELTEYRVLTSGGKKENIIPILSSRIEFYLNKNFPEIVNLSLILASQPKTIYSRFGKTLNDSRVSAEQPKDGISYLEKDTFKLTKTLYGKDKNKPLGILQAVFSLGHLLSKNFLENEIKIFPQEALLQQDQLFFTVRGLPYIFAFKPLPPSFWEFVIDSKFHILFALLYGVFLLAFGNIFGRRLRRKMFLIYRTQIRHLKGELHVTHEQNQLIKTEIAASQHLFALKKKAEKEYRNLWKDLQERYNSMITQGQAILNLTRRLILEGTELDSKKRKEIYEVFQESIVIFGHLANGFIMKGKEEDTDIVQSLNRIKKIFLPEFIERKAQVEIKDIRKKKDKIPYYLDKVILEVILHNIFYLLMDRLVIDNEVKIEIKANDPLEIVFYDNGHEVKDKIQNIIQGQLLENPLTIGKQRLREFIGHLGWQISFHTDKTLNIITLFIPKGLKDHELPSNVIKLFDFKNFS